MGAEHDAQARVQRTAIACGKLFTNRCKAVLQPVSESAGEAGHIKELTDLTHVHATFQAELFNRHTVVFTVLAATRVAGVGTGRQHEHVAVAVLVGFGEHVLHVGLPVAVCPGDRDVRAALGERLLQCGEQGTVLLVNGRDAAVGAVVGGDLFEALIRDAATSGYVAQERDDVLLPLGATEGGENHQVVGAHLFGALTGDAAFASVVAEGLLVEHGGAVGGGVRRVGAVGYHVVRQERAVEGYAVVRLMAHARTSATSSAPMRRPV